jgi:hypothetical protein
VPPLLALEVELALVELALVELAVVEVAVVEVAVVELVVVVLELDETVAAPPPWPVRPPLPLVVVPVPAVMTEPLQPTKAITDIATEA